MLVICWSVETIALKTARWRQLWFRKGTEEWLEDEEINKQKSRVPVSGGETKGRDTDKDEDEDEAEAEAVRAQKEQEAAADKAAEKKNLQYRALAEIGLTEQRLKDFDKRLADIHSVPAGFTASEMSYAIADDVFAEVLYSWHNRYRQAESGAADPRSVASPESGVNTPSELETGVSEDEGVTILGQKHDETTDRELGRTIRAASIAYAHTTARMDGAVQEGRGEPRPAADKAANKVPRHGSNGFVAACFTMDETMFGCN